MHSSLITKLLHYTNLKKNLKKNKTNKQTKKPKQKQPPPPPQKKQQKSKDKHFLQTKIILYIFTVKHFF